MKETFFSYYGISDERKAEMWDECLFAVDANVLLHIYRYSPDTRNKLIQIFKKASDRLWIPHQAALEYQENRLKVIKKQENAYGEIQDILKKYLDNIEKDLNSFKRHPFINKEDLKNRIQDFFGVIVNELDEKEKDHPKLIIDDDLRDELTELLDKKVGKSYEPTKLEKILEEGEKRYENKVPPGFKDDCCGDLILWFQLIDKSKSEERPIIFITDDRKEDWWFKFSGDTLGPRRELIEEIKSKAEQDFYMYSSDQFMEYAGPYFEIEVDQNAIDEVKEITFRYDRIIENNVNEFDRIVDDLFQEYLMFINNMDYEIRDLEKISNEIDLIENEIRFEHSINVLKEYLFKLDLLQDQFKIPHKLQSLIRDVKNVINHYSDENGVLQINSYQLEEMEKTLNSHRKKYTRVRFRIRSLREYILKK